MLNTLTGAICSEFSTIEKRRVSGFMRKVYLDLISNSRGTDDKYYFLIFDEEAGEIFVEYSWHNWSPKGIDQGSENISLAELKRRRPDVFQKAADLIITLFPHEEDKEKLSYPLEDSK